MANLVSRLSITIANGASLSGAVQISGGKVSFVEMSALWTTAVLTFQGSFDGTNYFNMYDDDSNEIIAFVEAGRRVHLSFSNLNKNKYIKVRSGTAINAVTQGAERVLYLEVWNE